MRCAVLVSLSFLLAGSMPAGAETVVSFVHPEQFTDAALRGGYGPKAEQSALSEIARYLESLGTRYLGTRQTLAIDVMNVDLAGQFEPWPAMAYDVRFMRDVYPPRIMLRYKLTEEQRTLIEGEEMVVDINYLANPRARPADDHLRYEKAMLADWFKVRIVEPKFVHASP